MQTTLFLLLKRKFKLHKCKSYNRGRQTAARGPITAREEKICGLRARNLFEWNAARERNFCGPRACKCGPRSKNIIKLIFIVI